MSPVTQSPVRYPDKRAYDGSPLTSTAVETMGWLDSNDGGARDRVVCDDLLLMSNFVFAYVAVEC